MEHRDIVWFGRFGCKRCGLCGGVGWRRWVLFVGFGWEQRAKWRGRIEGNIAQRRMQGTRWMWRVRRWSGELESCDLRREGKAAAVGSAFFVEKDLDPTQRDLVAFKKLLSFDIAAIEQRSKTTACVLDPESALFVHMELRMKTRDAGFAQKNIAAFVAADPYLRSVDIDLLSCVMADPDIQLWHVCAPSLGRPAA